MKHHGRSFGNKHLLVPASKMRRFAAFHLFMRVNEESLGGLAVDWEKKQFEANPGTPKKIKYQGKGGSFHLFYSVLGH